MTDILSFLDTLEVKEVDLDKEINDIWNPRFNLGWDEHSLLSINHEGFTSIAKHFFELGLQSRNPTTDEDLENSMTCQVGWHDGFVLDYTQEQQDKLLEKIGATVGDKVRVILIKE